MNLKLYNLYLFIIFPFLLIKFFVLDKKIFNILHDFKTRFLGNPFKNKNLKDFINRSDLIWIHAVSLGESHASIPLIERLIKRNQDSPQEVERRFNAFESVKLCNILIQ